MIKYLLILILLCFNICAFDLDNSIQKLNDEECDVREQATDEIIRNQTPEDITALYKLVLKYRKDSPEVAYRLNRCIMRIFCINFEAQDERALRLKGSLGIEYNVQSTWNSPWNSPNTFWIVSNMWCDSPAETKLKRWDTIIKIDGWSIQQWNAYQLNKFNYTEYGLFVPNKEYTLTVKRPKNPDDLDDRNGYLRDTDEYTLEEVKVTTYTFITESNQNILDELIEKEWLAFRNNLTKQN